MAARKSTPRTRKGQTRERWLPIFGYPHYSVSSRGRVRNKRGLILKQTRMKKRYLVVGLWEKGKGKLFLVHRLVARAFIGPCPEKYQVNHIDNRRGNNCIENLEYVTQSQNMLHASRVHGSLLGEKNPSAKVNQKLVAEIRQKHADGFGYKRLAKHFGLGWGLVRAIATRRTWTHLP